MARHKKNIMRTQTKQLNRISKAGLSGLLKSALRLPNLPGQKMVSRLNTTTDFNINIQKRAKTCATAKNSLTAIIAMATALAFTGCGMVGHDYTKVTPQEPARWHAKLENGLSSHPIPRETMARWWTVLGDPLLTSLEEQAARNNLTLKEAEARVREARARRGISKAGLLPRLDAGASATKLRGSESAKTSGITELYTFGFDAAWELDIFGGKRRAVQAAQADLEASQDNRRDALVTLMAEVGLNYVDVRTYQNRLAVAQASITTQQQTYELNRSRYQAGLSDELAVQQSLYNLEHSRSLIPGMRIRLAAAKNRLAILLGKNPGALNNELAASGPVPVPPLTVAVGVPADTLRRRPDVRRAERNLAAQTARIGVATADLYPKFQLPGSIGLESLSAKHLLAWGSRNWSIGPVISWNIFNAGAIRQNIKVQTARQKQALIQYQSTILGAQEEVENALVAYAKEQNRRKFLTKTVAAAKRAGLLAQNRYQAGLADFNSVLAAQRALLSFKDELIQSEGAVTTNLVRLYKALGGGWKSMPAKPE